MNHPDVQEGDPVIVFAPNFYRAARIGFFKGPCRDHDGAFLVDLLDDDAPIRVVCAGIDSRDTIEILGKETHS